MKLWSIIKILIIGYAFWYVISEILSILLNPIPTKEVSMKLIYKLFKIAIVINRIMFLIRKKIKKNKILSNNKLMD